jgi:hypothetical protein
MIGLAASGCLLIEMSCEAPDEILDELHLTIQKGFKTKIAQTMH